MTKDWLTILLQADETRATFCQQLHGKFFEVPLKSYTQHSYAHIELCLHFSEEEEEEIRRSNKLRVFGSIHTDNSFSNQRPRPAVEEGDDEKDKDLSPTIPLITKLRRVPEEDKRTGPTRTKGRREMSNNAIWTSHL